MQIILASTSRYRAQQLRDTGLRFKAVAPPFDEEAFKKRSTRRAPRVLAQKLAYEKALSVARSLPQTRDAVVIGADQLVSMKGRILGKPGDAKKACAMLAAMQGRSHKLITAVCLVAVKNGKISSIEQSTDTVNIRLRRLTRAQIARYVRRDQPYDCAGSYRFEKGGLALVEKMKLRDPSSVIGLPMIELIAMLSRVCKLETIL